MESSAATVALVLHPYSVAIWGDAPKNPLNRGAASHVSFYVLIASMTPWLMGAGDKCKRKEKHG